MIQSIVLERIRSNSSGNKAIIAGFRDLVKVWGQLKFAKNKNLIRKKIVVD
jgi:hypothetical protein